MEQAGLRACRASASTISHLQGWAQAHPGRATATVTRETSTQGQMGTTPTARMEMNHEVPPGSGEAG